MKKLYPLFLFLLLSFFPKAQNDGDFIVKGLVTVQPDALLYIEGDTVDIQSTGTLDIQASGSQHGLVKVNVHTSGTGRWICNGTTTGGGDVLFTGTDIDYIVSGNTTSFPNLILDFGDAPVGGQILQTMTLSNNARVTNTLTLTKGRIVTGSNELHLANSDPDAITGSFGADKSRYIQGALKWDVQTGTDNYYFFPIGGAPSLSKRGYNPASIDLRTLSGIDGVIPAGATSLTGKFVDQDDIGTVALQYTTSGDCYFTTAQQYLEFYWMVKEFGYWSFEPNDTFRHGWNYDFYCFPDMPHINATNPGLTHLKVFKAPSSDPAPSASYDWTSNFFQSGNPCNGVNVAYPGDTLLWFPGENLPMEETDRIAAWDLKSFSRFGIGGGTGAGLPIELLELKAYPVNNKFIKVDWATATETNNAGFEVLRSTDGINFIQVGNFVTSKGINGNSSVTLRYDYNDHDVVPNQLYYYRLRQVDLSGSAELTYVVSAMITESITFTISEFIPNPSENDSRIEVVTSKERDLNITVYNTLGQITMQQNFHAVAGKNTINFNFNLLADGTYYAIIRTDNEFYNRKLILTK